jgi:hypothetical protein
MVLLAIDGRESIHAILRIARPAYYFALREPGQWQLPGSPQVINGQIVGRNEIQQGAFFTA